MYLYIVSFVILVLVMFVMMWNVGFMLVRSRRVVELVGDCIRS